MKPDSDVSISGYGDERNRSSTEWTPSIIDDSDCEGRSSSTLSWTDDADNTVAEQLRLRFEQFEAALYSEAPSDMLTNSERAEKEIWNEYTPHLRVTGKKVNLIRRDYLSDEGSSRSSSPGVEEVIVQDPEVLVDTGGKRGRTSSCRSGSSGSKDSISVKEDPEVAERMALAVAEKLLEQAVPNAKRVGLVPKPSKSRHLSPRKVSAQSQPSAESDSSFKENSPSFRVLPSKDERTAHTEVSLNPLNCQTTPRHNRAKSSHSNFLKPLSRNSRNPCSARHSRKKSEKKEHETESMSDNPLDSPDLTARHGFLPPIESLTITPKLPSKRANSAMLRFAKVQPRTRPTTSRSKSLYLAPIESFSICQSNKFTITPIAENSSSVFSSRLPLYPSRRSNNRSNPPRWRY